MYYPKNQIETNLWSDGDLVFSNNTRQPYTGFYFKTSDGKYFSGKEPNEGFNQPLRKAPPAYDGPVTLSDIAPQPLHIPVDYRFIGENTNYSILTNKSRGVPFFPIPYHPVMNQTYINEGYFTRYFIKKSNENLYTEVERAVYNFSSTSNLYLAINMQWIIKGNREKVFDTNQKQTIFTERKYRITGLQSFLNQNYLEFYQG